MALLQAPASYKKQNGILVISEDLKSICWTSVPSRDDSSPIVLAVDSITKVARTLFSDPKVALKIFTKTGDQIEPVADVFLFTSAFARKELNEITDVLVSVIDPYDFKQTPVDTEPLCTSSGVLCTPKAKATAGPRSPAKPKPLKTLPRVNVAETEKQDTLDESSQTTTCCTDFVERSEYFNLLNSLFQNPATCHGAASARALLWGAAGSGKRQIASHFAIHHAAETGKTVLWVEALSTESFVRDYQKAFETITGSQLHPTLDIFQLLRKIRRALEACRNKWILVLFDVNKSFLDSANVFGTNLLNHLPDWGHIVATTSSIIVNIDTAPETMSCAISMANCVPIQVHEWTDEELEDYFNVRGLAVEASYVDPDMYGPAGFTPLMAAISCSIVQHLGLTPLQYHSYFKRTLEQRGGLRQAEMLRTLSPVFSTIMTMAWDTIRDNDVAAMDLIMYLTVVASVSISMTLLRRLKCFGNAVEDRLSRAIAFMLSLSLITKDGEENIVMHSLVRRFFELKAHDTHGQRYALFVIEWIRALNEHMVEDKGRDVVPVEHFDPHIASTQPKPNSESCCALLPHLQSVAMAATRYNVRTESFIFWLRNVATFMIQDNYHHNIAESLISQALSLQRLPSSPSSISPEVYDHFEMREVKIKALMKGCKFVDAEIETKDCLRRLVGSDLDEEFRMRMVGRFWSYAADDFIEIGEFSNALHVLQRNVLTVDTEFEIARRHHRLAKCLRKLREPLLAVKHSHMAMAYWDKCAAKWDDRELLNWADEHSYLLLVLNKYKGALQFMLPLLERCLDLYDCVSEKVWHKVYNIVSIYSFDPCSFDKAETVVLKILSKVSVEELSGPALASCLRTLNSLAGMFRKQGRDIEAEALYRHNVHLEFDQVRSGINDGNTKGFSYNRLDLIACLEEQEKIGECRIYQDQFQSMGLHQDMEQSLRNLRNNSKAERFIYIQALEALQAGDKIEWVPNFGTADQLRLESAIRRYGSLEDRVRNGRHLYCDIDIHGLTAAKKSRVLHLLELDVVYHSFAAPDGSFIVFPRFDQTLIGQYFPFCDCRKYRKRSRSISPMELIDKRFIIVDDAAEPRHNTYKQKQITDWLLRVPKTPELALDRVSGRSHGFSSENEVSLVFENDRYSGHVIHQISTKPRKGPRSPICGAAGDSVSVDKVAGTITWNSGAFENFEHEDESYIVPDALNIPSIVIQVPPSDNPEEELSASGIKFIDSSRQNMQKVTNFFPATKIFCIGEEGNSVSHGLHLDDIPEEVAHDHIDPSNIFDSLSGP